MVIAADIALVLVAAHAMGIFGVDFVFSVLFLVTLWLEQHAHLLLWEAAY